MIQSLNFDHLSSIYPLILTHTDENKLSNKIKYISLALLVAELLIPKVGDHFTKTIIENTGNFLMFLLKCLQNVPTPPILLPFTQLKAVLYR